MKIDTHARCATVLMLAALLNSVVGCDKNDASPSSESSRAAENAVETAVTPSNRVDIPDAVRQNLGITFAKVIPRNVAQTLRVPGNFELLPTARREYRTPFAGRVEILVEQYASIASGTPLFRVDSSEWRDLGERIAATRARVDSMEPLRNAHRAHEVSLAERVALWQERLQQLAEIRQAGGANATQVTEARSTLNSTQAELADVMERDAMLEAEHRVVESELRSLLARRDALMRSSGNTTSTADSGGELSTPDATQPANNDEFSAENATFYHVCARTAGVIESIAVTNGTLVEPSELVITVVDPRKIRFRARGLQSDITRLTDGLPAQVTSAQVGEAGRDESMHGALMLGLAADPQERTIDLLLQPTTLAAWARAGVAAYLEVTLAGGQEELAVPLQAIARDAGTPILFRRDPQDPNRAIRMEADLGVSDGRWVVIRSGVKEGDEVVVAGNYQLMLATSGSAAKGGHFHSDGTFHEGKD